MTQGLQAWKLFLLLGSPLQTLLQGFPHLAGTGQSFGRQVTFLTPQLPRPVQTVAVASGTNASAALSAGG